jgi:peptidoglycan/LPS O-acetylase OafA/YrhL
MSVLEPTWDKRLEHESANAFDAIRLLLATLVVFEHSFFLIDNNYYQDPLFRLSHGQLNCGQLAVYMFFALSGFLVTRSLLTTRSVKSFMMRRVTRIAPGFVVASAFGCLVVGPLTTNDVGRYLDSQNWLILLMKTLTFNQIAVSEVLDRNAVRLVHGTLWSIKYEFDCYLLIGGLGALGLLRPRWAVVTSSVIAASLGVVCVFPQLLPKIDYGILALLMSSPHRWPELMPIFFLGSAFYMFRTSIPKSSVVVSGAVAAWIVSLLTGGAHWATLICGIYAVLYAALSFKAEIQVFGKRTDLSYGVYLYGWPIQQLVLFYSPVPISPLGLFSLSIVLTMGVAYLSWIHVERPSLLLLRNLERPATTGAVADKLLRR